jgi:hypothetical protein
MGTRDSRVDAYIKKAAPFARPILEHLRELVHRAEPAIEETIKWGMPFFERGGIVCHMAAFKAHVAFGFWRGRLDAPTGREKEAMGNFGRIGSIDDLPADRTVIALVRKAAARAKQEAAAPVKPAPARRAKPELPVPKDLAAALKKNAKARRTFEGFPPSHRREYVEWIAEAKTDATRARRLATTLEWLAEGKPRNWKYMRKPGAK